MNNDIQIRLIIKSVNYYNITEDLSDIKFNLIFKNISKISDVYWHYTNGLPYNWKFLINESIQTFLNNDIKLIMYDENIIEDNVHLGNIDMNINKFVDFYKNIDLKNLNYQIDFVNINNMDQLKIYDPMKFPNLAPGVYINKITKDIIKDLEKVGEVDLDIIILSQSLANLYLTGEGRSNPNQFPYFESFKKNYRILIENKNEDNLINVINDNLSTNDEFQYTKYAEAFSKIINNNKISLPLLIGIYASKGVGKSHLLHLISNQVDTDYRQKYPKKKGFCKNTDLDNEYNYINIHFNAWIFSGTDFLWAGLVTALYTEIETYYGVIYTRFFRIEQKIFPSLYDKIKFIILLTCLISLIIISIILYYYSDIKDTWIYVTSVISGILSLGFFKNMLTIGKYFLFSFASEIKNAASTPNFSAKLGFMNDVKNEIQEIIIPLLIKSKTRVILYIDDLDKCAPDKIVDVLEAIQLLLSDPHCPFIVFLSADSNIIIQAIESYYKVKYNNFTDINGYEYLNKMMAISFSIPNVNTITKFNILKNVAIKEEIKVLKENCETNINTFIAEHNELTDFKKYKNNKNIIKLFYKQYITDDIENQLKHNINKFKISNEEYKYKLINLYISNQKKTTELTEIIIKDTESLNVNYREENNNNLISNTNIFLNNIENTITDNTGPYDNFEELYYSLDKLENQLLKKNILQFKLRIINIKNNIHNYFDIQKENIINKLFKGYTEEETTVFCDLSYYLGNNMNVRRSKRVINMYNISRYIIPSYLFEFRPYIIQIIIMAEFWNYRMTWLMLIIDNKHKTQILKKGNFINKIENISLEKFYLKEVSDIVLKYRNKISASIRQTDYNISDFLNILKYNNIQVIHFYKLYNYIFNLDQCLKVILDKLE